MLSRIKRQQEEAQAATRSGGESAINQPGQKESMAVLRLKNDLDNLDGICSKVVIPDPDNMLRMKVTVRPSRPSIWHGGFFDFLLEFREEYPYEGPRVRYVGPNRVWHPNIEGSEFAEKEGMEKASRKTEWSVCLSFQTDWKPTFSLRDVIIMIELLFQDPNPDDPLHGTSKQAAQMMKDDPVRFRTKARYWMSGHYID
ncbi:ubiquitin-conjugating enzyme E2, putative [Trypanosoma equiperdum]|uniref:Ubiquitin-conjugating enzyme E2, putative n=2 Tax=Trypanozoon TaxID=39700 RepID=Q57TW2_TRYB2|nr:ubiquitin-conjugating enzyme E2, putative [Trypanosoma brucei brucei TREU927]AAX80012.1 ubiquitin-conjugating enzyme E2, putative [Trypanosoma brucei]AAZ13415.1 ubiquitin-conjugating enzyme E2, putative [Trypanosoma brucei brucei TREU927]SCU70949.1 ubiquitin-conjugating enzyme E2, putative [Trypanosoma equiperdum]